MYCTVNWGSPVNSETTVGCYTLTLCHCCCVSMNNANFSTSNTPDLFYERPKYKDIKLVYFLFGATLFCDMNTPLILSLIRWGRGGEARNTPPPTSEIGVGILA